MLRVTIELIPHGKVAERKVIAAANIGNDGTGDESTGNYDYCLFDKGGKRYKLGRVEGFPRKRLLAFDLLYRALKQAIGGRNGD